MRSAIPLGLMSLLREFGEGCRGAAPFDGFIDGEYIYKPLAVEKYVKNIFDTASLSVLLDWSSVSSAEFSKFSISLSLVECR